MSEYRLGSTWETVVYVGIGLAFLAFVFYFGVLHPEILIEAFRK